MGICTLAFSAAVPLFADVTIQATGTNYGFSQAGVYTSPYSGTVTPAGGSPVSSWLICDDYFDDTYLGESWSATATSVSSLPTTSPSPVLYNGTTWGSGVNTVSLNQVQEYAVISILAEQMLAVVQNEPSDDDSQRAADEATAAAYGFAIWNFTNINGYPVFDASNPNRKTSTWDSCGQNDLPGVCSSQSTNVLRTLSEDEIASILGYITSAVSSIAGESDDALRSQFANVTIYNWNPNTPPTGCGGCTSAPQEFIGVSAVAMPEPGTPLLLLFYCSCAAILGYLFRRRIFTKLPTR
jgi:hypothetical protein